MKDEVLFRLHSQRPEFARRVALAQSVIEQWLSQCHRPYISFSGGKDSTCLLALVREQKIDCPAVYFDADSSFPEVAVLLNSTENLLCYRTDEPLLDTLRRIGLSGAAQLDKATMENTVWGPIRRLIAEHRFDAVTYGLRTEESRGRKLHCYTRGPIFRYQRDSVLACQPLAHWNYLDVWAFIVSRNLPYCGVYDRMWDLAREDQRVSYWAGETKRRYGRYTFLKRHYPALWNQLAASLPEVTAYA